MVPADGAMHQCDTTTKSRPARHRLSRHHRRRDAGLDRQPGLGHDRILQLARVL